MRKYLILSTIAFLLLLVWKVSSSTSIALACECRDQAAPVAPAHWEWRSTHARYNLHFIALYISSLAIAFVLVGLRPAVKTVAGLIQAIRSRKTHSLLLACLLLQPFHATLAEAATFMYPNGTSVVDFPHDVVFKSGVRAGGSSGILFDTQNKADITFNAGPDHGVELVGTTLASNPSIGRFLGQPVPVRPKSHRFQANRYYQAVRSVIPASFWEFPQNLNEILANLNVVPAFVVFGLASSLKLGIIKYQQCILLASLLLPPFHVPIAEAGTFMYPNGTTVMDFTHNLVVQTGSRPDTLENEVNNVTYTKRFTAGMLFDTRNKADITFNAGPDHAVQLVTSRFDLVGATLNLTGLGKVNFDQILSQSLLINGTLITTTDSDVDIVLSPKGGGVVRVGKTLDVRGVTLLLDDDQISGDKIEGGVISAVTITNLTTTQLNIDIIGTDVKLAAGKTLDVSEGTLQLRHGQISGDKVRGGTIDDVTITTLKAEILTGNMSLAAGRTLDVSQGSLIFAENQISGDSINGGTIDATTITTLTAGTVKSNTLTTTSGDISLNPVGTVTLPSGKTLDVSQGVLVLADDQISGDKIKGGAILVTNLTATRINVDTIGTTVKIAPGESLDVRGATLLVDQMSIDNLKLDGNSVRSMSGDLELMCSAGQVVKVGDTLAVGELVMKGNTLNTTDHNTLLLAPHGLGSVKVAEGKTLDLRGATLLLDDDAIRGDKVDGGFIHNITIVELVSGQIQIGSLKLAGETISSTGDIQLKPSTGRKVEVTKPLEVEKLHFEDTTIATTTGIPVTINNMTCPVATFSRVTAGVILIEDNEITCTGSTCDVEIGASGTGDIVLKSDVVLSSGKSITGGSEATFTSIKASTISTTSGDLTLNPTGNNVRVASGKTLDLSGATLKLDDNAISGDKVEGWTMDAITINQLQVNGTVQVENGVIAKGGFRDSHAWGSETARRSQLALAINMGGLGSSVFTGGPMNANFFEGYDASGTSPGNMIGFVGAVFDGRFVYFVPYNDGSRHGRVLRCDTQSSFTSSSSWTGYDASGTSPGNMKGFMGAAFDGRFVYFVPYNDGSAVLRYDTQSSFTSSSSWTGYDASGTSPGDMKGFFGAVFDGRFVYYVPSFDGSARHGRVLRYDTHLSFTSSSSWTGYDASGTSPGSMKGFRGAVFDGRFVYFVPYNDGSYHGKVLRYDTQSNFTSSSSWTGYDVSGTSPGSMKGFRGAVFDGRFVYFVPYWDDSAYSGKVLRYDTQSSFTLSSSWTGYDAINTSPGNMKGFEGAVFGGRFVYFVPQRDESAFSGRVLRYDTQSSFTSSSSWTGYDVSGTSPGSMKGFRGAVFDGRFVYFVPHYNGSIYHGRVLRYDTRAPQPRPSLAQIATSSDLFIASNGSVGIGTKSPGEKLTVEGGLKVTGTVVVPDNSISGDKVEGGTINAIEINTLTARQAGVGGTLQVNGTVLVGGGGVISTGGYKDSHAWGSETARRSQLTHGGDGLGNSVAVGGPMNASFFAGYDASGISPGTMVGFLAAVFDGRFVYFVPGYYGGTHGRVLRYDTSGDFTSSLSWMGYDASGTSPGTMKGFQGAVFDGRFIYFAPHHDHVSYSGKVLRYDTTSSFTSAASWMGHDASETGPGNMKGFYGAVFDGRYVYMVPFYADSANHGRVLRYDTKQSFVSNNSWTGYDATGTGPGNMKGFKGAVFDGRFIYFVPHTDGSGGSGASGKVLRYDTTSSFKSSSSWAGYDAGNTSPGDMKGYGGAVFDGRFIYFAPRSSWSHGRVLRYDTMSSFTSSSSWSGFDASGISPGNMVGFKGAVFDGRFVCFVPGCDTYVTVYHGKVLRYDTMSSFASSPSWAGFDASGTSPGGMAGFTGAVFDGRYVYFAPLNNGIAAIGKVLRYDTRAPQPRPSIQQIASNKDLFIASDGRVGIGTTSPDEMLHVVGNIKATGTVTATTCCGSDIRLKKDVTSLSGALETIKKMRGIRYKWKSNSEPSIGFVAQELEQVVPEVVVTGSDGYKAIDYGKLSAVLAVAVQEVEEKHNKMEQQQKESNDKIHALIQRVESLEEAIRGSA